MEIKKRVDALLEKMAERNLDAYIIPTSDPHQSEYLSDYYKTREFITGFTGSAGTAVVTRKKCGLWTDGRYFIQAEKQLEGTPFKLYRLGIDQSLMDFLKENVPEFGKIGFDGKTFSDREYKALSENMESRMLVTDVDYISEIWKDRPSLPKDKMFVHKLEYAGQSVREKLNILRHMMKKKQVDCTIIGALEDVCYLYNIRGNDVEATPVVISYAYVDMNEARLYVDEDKLTDEVVEHLKKAGVDIYRYDSIYEMMGQIPAQSHVYLDPSRTNMKLVESLKSNIRIARGMNFTTMMKAVKNEVEINNQKKAYIKDGVALVKFFHWVETGVFSETITEMLAAEKLLAFRQEQENFLEYSFPTISAYGENAALPHYAPSHEHPVTLKPRGLYLVDSGGQYLEGTTDITRTVALGETTYEEKLHYTLTLKAHIAAMKAVFKKGTTGSYIDAVARYPIQQELLDFNHGTGHGVGNLLSVHEGPQNFSRRDRGVAIVPGMITSVEPGVYIPGEHGIRIESIVVCVKAGENEFGTFYKFEPLTYVPIDTRPVLRSRLESSELEWLNRYNEECRNRLSPYLEGEELAYLEEQTKPL